MIRRRTSAALLGALGFAAAAPAAAQAAAPANDAPTAPAAFTAITAENGTPTERQGIAELVEATADAGVPRCLGPGSFDRTVWFTVPAADVPRELSVEAAGRTTAVLDVAAFVQPAGATTAAPSTVEPNACAGVGSGAADASEEPTAGIGLRIPAGRTVLIQIGRRGERKSADDERAIVSLGSRNLPATPAPVGDVADAQTPTLDPGTTPIALGGATLTQEDPAQPPCPSLGSVWRRVVPAATGMQTYTAGGEQVATLAVFAGERPTGDEVLGCVNRERSAGDLAVTVAAVKDVPLWIRLGTDRPAPDAMGSLTLAAGGPPVTDGGPGGGDPIVGTPSGPSKIVTATTPGAGMGSMPLTPGTPGSGTGSTPRPGTSRCPALGRAPKPSRTDTRVRFAATRGRAADRTKARRLTVRIAKLTGRRRSGRVVLVGPCKRVYARSAFVALSRGKRITLKRLAGRALVPGTYRLQVDIRNSKRGKRTYVPTTASFRLR